MSISSKRGDGGISQLGSGEAVPKYHPVLECMGTIEELEAFVRDAGYTVVNSYAQDCLELVANDLSDLIAALAGKAEAAVGIRSALKTVEERLVHLEEKLVIGGFIKLAQTPESAKLDICRTVCRRAERHLVKLAMAEPKAVYTQALPYLNRLSDLLFMLARFIEDEQAALHYRTC